MRSKTRAGWGTVGLLVVATLAWAPPASAQEVSLTVGRFLGDELATSDLSPGDLIPDDFSDATLYGVRVGTGLVFFNFEASALTGKSALFEDTEFALDARFTYLEGSAILNLFPGPVSPFVAAGVGLHRIQFSGPVEVDETQMGYNVGAGVKVVLGSVGVRADLRDHITPMDLEGTAAELVEFLQLEDDTTLHNFEVSLGLVVRF